MLKKAVKRYLDRYFDEWAESRGGLPAVPFDEDMETKLFVGEPDDDEYICWQYKENPQLTDFGALEAKTGVELPQQIKDYYTSYLFLQFEGFYEGKPIWLNPITDETDILAELEYSLLNENPDRIEIGVLSDSDLPLCVDVKTGRVIVWDYEREKSCILSNSLLELFEKLTPAR